jgi:hypothetical protein
MRNITINEDETGWFRWTDGNASELMDLSEAADAFEGLLEDNEKFTITFE